MNKREHLFIELVVLSLFSFIIIYPCIFIASSYYGDFVKSIFELEFTPFLKTHLVNLDTLLGNKKVMLLFKVSKAACLLIFAWLISIWLDYFTQQTKRITQFLIKISQSFSQSFKKNQLEFISFSKEAKFTLSALLIIHVVGYFYCLINCPTQYDELFSYRYFSSKGVWASLSYYPVPNNHVLYNIIASFCIAIPLWTEKMMRLPSIIASIITIYYFFKVFKSK